MALVSTRIPRDVPRCILEAQDEDRVVARLEIRTPTPGLLVAGRLQLEPGCDARAACEAFATQAVAAVGADGGEVLLVERPENDAWRAALEARGFVVVRRKAFVGRELGSALPDVPGGLALRSLAEAGEATFIARMHEASRGDPFEERRPAVRDLAAEWQDLVASAGVRFDPARWVLVEDADGPLGLVLPQRVNATTGTLYYLGVVPARRGRGLGRAIHALGLRLLADAGLVRYVGSTDVRNAAMLAVFARNGCPVEGTEVYLAMPPP